jgi:hypothetical protein
MVAMRNVYKILAGKPNEKRELGRIKEIRREGVDWIHLAQDRVQWRALLCTVMDLRVP